MVRRVLGGALVPLVVSIAVFTLVRLAPGDPVDMMLPPENRGPGAEQFVAAKRAELGLDRSLPEQYLAWAWHAVRGDLGYSTRGRPVAALLGERVGPTMVLMGTGLLLAVLVALPVGIAAAMRRGRWTDRLVAVLSAGAVSIPVFVLGMVAIHLFSLRLGLFPSSGMHTPGRESAADTLAHLVLPALVLALAQAGAFTRHVRAAVGTALDRDHVRAAHAAGIGELRVVTRHVLRNALPPLIAVVALALPGLLAGAVVVETVFGWPGMGQLAVSAVVARDHPVLIGFAVVVAVLVLVSGWLADVAHAVVDPRIR